MGLLRALAAQPGVEVLAMGLAEPESKSTPPSFPWHAVRAPHRKSFPSLMHPLPHMAYVVSPAAYRDELRRLLTAEEWDAVFVDHLRMGWAIRLVRRLRPQAAIVYASQNHETSVRRSVARAEHNWAKRVVRELEARKVAWLERRLVDAATTVTAITESDAALYRPQARRVVEVSPGYSGDSLATRAISTSTPRRVALLGNLLWTVKQDNLRLFLDAADGALTDAGIQAAVIGPVPPAFRTELERRYRSIVVTGRVDSVAAELAQARLGVISQPQGGGFKLRALDYVFNRVPIVTLAGSADGLPLVPGTSMLECPSEATVAEAIVATIDDFDTLNRLQEAAFTACHDAYNWDARGAALVGAVTGSDAVRP